MQIIGDTFGNMVWVSERDCSAQRRHQKLIEESPAPAFADDVREAMGAAAILVAQAVGYTNAGTVEFIYQDGEFFFLEMNTRLQVEHPVTEMVSGIDLVAEQIRVASGEPLSFTQGAIERRGHAIEIRINAENPAGGRFLPSPGQDHQASRGRRASAPAGTAATRPATRSASTTTTSSASSIVWGKDRDDRHPPRHPGAGGDEIEGVATTIPADLAILRARGLPGSPALHEVGGGDARPHRRRRSGQARRRPTTAPRRSSSGRPPSR